MSDQDSRSIPDSHSLQMRKLKECQGCVAMTFGHVHAATSNGDSDGGTRNSTPTVWKDDWAPDLTDNHRSEQDNIIQHKIPSCRETPRVTLIKHSEAIPREQLRWTYFSFFPPTTRFVSERSRTVSKGL